MNIVLKKGFKLILTHLLSLALTLFLVFVLGWLISKWGFYPFSVIASLFYIGLFYSEGWNWGRHEGRKYNDIKESPIRALISSVVPSIICIAFSILMAFGFYKEILIIIVKAWYFPFVGFYSSTDSIKVTEILMSGAVIPIVVTLGYAIGVKNFSVMEKIAYRKNRQREQAKKTQMNK